MNCNICRNKEICKGVSDMDRIKKIHWDTVTNHTAWERICRLLDKAKIEYISLRATGRERIEIPESGGIFRYKMVKIDKQT